MEVLTEMEVKMRKVEIVEKILAGEIFIHPTDTIYGIGCNALNPKSVEKIRELKDRFDKPLSVWAPSKNWITDNCNISQEWLEKLPGPYTLILNVIKKNCVSKPVNLGGETLGVRLPKHWFSTILEEAGVPIITTSANKAGMRFMRDLGDLDKNMENSVEFAVYEGEKEAKPSKIINLVENTELERD